MSRGLRGKNTTGNELKPGFKGSAASCYWNENKGSIEREACVSSLDFSSSQIEMCAAFMFVVSWWEISGIMEDAVRGWRGQW